MNERIAQLAALATPTEETMVVAAGLSLAGMLGSILILCAALWHMPPDYFARPEPPPSRWDAARPTIRRAVRVARNVGGLVLIAAGVAMLALPGQGLLTILVGLVLVDVPGKRRAEMELARRRSVMSALNGVRRRMRRPPFEVPAD